MVKGVNKQVIEVMETGNEYFERAILVVRAQKANKSKAMLEQKAADYIDSFGQSPLPRLRKKRSRRRQMALALANRLCWAGAGALCALLFYWL